MNPNFCSKYLGTGLPWALYEDNVVLIADSLKNTKKFRNWKEGK